MNRRTRIARTARLQSRTRLTRTARLNPVSGKRLAAMSGLGVSAPNKGRAAGTATGAPKPPGEFAAKVKLLVRTRAGRGDADMACCEGCWRWLGPHAGEFQHRRARGSGGCRDEVINGPANCLLLCRPCHLEAEERRRDLSQDGAGFWIEHGNGPDYDPRSAAVMLGALGNSGVTVWLAADGLGPDGTGYLPRCPAVAA